MTDDRNAEEAIDQYVALNSENECWIVAARGALAFRFGPYKPQEAGKIMVESLDRKVAVSLVMNCGTVIDWDFLADGFSVESDESSVTS